ncbi:hypothetical protein BDW02DRAFT_398648 [Decorospora gaudefroyi]|uniref:Malate dehydrogenase n=1 Tax=Decorospora gaudefroyi TaxID=184978 RepID=A0A6A5K9V7_9PLEO|nr:hypothetical protein BDW02DRAFT_398648 [Decorospora gaudefroyi]
MIFPSTLSLLLAFAPTTLLAAPTDTVESIAGLIPRQDIPAGVYQELKKTNALCDLSNVKLPVAPTPLSAPAVGTKLRHIAIGRGTQNYTCATDSASEAPKAVGAVASLFNATCDAARLNVATLGQVTTLALNYAIPTSGEAEKRLSGHHEFTAAGVPLFVLQTDAVNYGRVEVALNEKTPAPPTATLGTNGLGSVPWLKLNATADGDWQYNQVYRVATAGGQAPKTCEGIQGAFTVEYSAQYWFYG